MTKDPYRYFRIEARELLEAARKVGARAEKGASGKDGHRAAAAPGAHAQGGVARRQAAGRSREDAHAIEDVLAPFREGGASRARGGLNRLLELVDGIGGRLASIDPAAEPPCQGEAPAWSPDDASETVRIEIRGGGRVSSRASRRRRCYVHGLERQSSSLAHAIGLAETLVEHLAPHRAREIGAAADAGFLGQICSLAEEIRDSLERWERDVSNSVEQVSTELRQVRDTANRLRLLPASSIFPPLERAARDAAHALGKKIAFDTSGGNIRIDAHVLTALRDALTHAVRNAVAHGIEGEAGRAAAGQARLRTHHAVGGAARPSDRLHLPRRWAAASMWTQSGAPPPAAACSPLAPPRSGRASAPRAPLEGWSHDGHERDGALGARGGARRRTRDRCAAEGRGLLAERARTRSDARDLRTRLAVVPACPAGG